MTKLGDDYIPPKEIVPETMPFSCKWMLSILNKAISKTVLALDSYEFADAAIAKMVYGYFILLPFVTEELWQRLPSKEDCARKESIVISEYPSTVEVLSESDDALVGCIIDVVNKALSVYLKLQGNINVEAKLEKLKKKMEEIQKQCDVMRKKTSASGYQEKVPVRIREVDEAKLASLMQELLSFKEASEHLQRENSSSGHEIFNPEPIQEDCTNNRWKWFKGCLGALDGTYIPVQVAQTDKGHYRNWKGNLSVNVLAICDINMNYVYILSGWEGSAADIRVLKDAITRENGLRVPNGSYYLCDSGYTNGDGFLAPYRGVRYHMQEWNVSRTPLQNAHDFFNKVHAKARNVIERSFAVLKRRWAILRSNLFYPIKVQNRIIMACALLHDYIRMEMHIDPLEAEIPEVDDPAIAFIEQVEPSQQWTNWRENLATTMKEMDCAASQVRSANTQGKEGKSTRRLWSVQEERALACALKELVVRGYKSDNGFKMGYQIVLEQLMRQAMPGTNLRADPTSIQEFKCGRKIMALYPQCCRVLNLTDSNARTLRHKTWPLYKEWIEIFGKDRATGEHAEGFVDIVQDVLNNGLTRGKGKDKEVEGNYVPLFNNSQFDEVQSMDVSRGTSSNVNKSKTTRKRKQADEEDDQFIAVFNSFYDKVDGRLGNISKCLGFEHDASNSRKEVLEALSEVSGLTMEEQVIVLHYLVNKTQSMDLFFSLPNDAKTTMVKLLLEGRFIG
ncbi:hypothetical protein BUALT_Bualt09G0073800 [Buddleja alternifolia]|uniref:DDE Tnp4 domain-containing protein n=1 Tax=Buddleja alternifolia TaxID=168488 RepID=A0AAV6X7X9_9LAMI|nr:hypothetical protein BUALT_Bualt09G0073800 [Buddleja alternifolia]